MTKAPTKKPAAPTAPSLDIEPLKQGRITLRLIGTTPLYFNAMSAKAKRTLLVGGTKKTAAQKKAEMKHDPEAEFRDSVYKTRTGPTLLALPSPAVKGAMSIAALETPGAKKTTIERLIFTPQYLIPVWGKPFLKMDIVRSADMAKTPDVRTRAFLPRWCTEIELAFVSPNLSTHDVVSLVANAGIICGIGDFRQQKGKGSFGTFAVAGAEDMGEWQEVWDEITQDGREVQEAAMAHPQPYDEEASELMLFLESERKKRAA